MQSVIGGGRVVVVFLALTLVVVASLAFGGLGGRPGGQGVIRVVRVWSDSVDAPQGMSFYLLYVNVTNTRATSWHVDPAQFTLSSNGSHSYSPVSNYSEVALFRTSDITIGGSVAGFVSFLLPTSEAPSKLSYEDQGAVLRAAEIPAVSGIASKFDPSVHVSLVGTPAAKAVASWNGITNQTNALAFFGEEPGYRNYSFVFFTGQKIYVTFALYYYKFPYDPNSITVASVTNDDGYAVSDVTAWQDFGGPVLAHQLPVKLTGYGANVEVTLLVTVPAGPQPGVLHFTLHFLG